MTINLSDYQEEDERKVAEHLRFAMIELRAAREIAHNKVPSLHTKLTQLLNELARLHEIWT